jgi:hypothetical protein
MIYQQHDIVPLYDSVGHLPNARESCALHIQGCSMDVALALRIFLLVDGCGGNICVLRAAASLPWPWLLLQLHTIAAKL